jgi:hypothetical protein
VACDNASITVNNRACDDESSDFSAIFNNNPDRNRLRQFIGRSDFRLPVLCDIRSALIWRSIHGYAVQFLSAIRKYDPCRTIRVRECVIRRVVSGWVSRALIGVNGSVRAGPWHFKLPPIGIVGSTHTERPDRRQ